jgi:hypothetical protein
VTGPLTIELEPVTGSYTAGDSGGEFCFDVVGTIPPNVSAAANPTETWLRVNANSVLPVALACTGGTVNDNGTPDDDTDDTVDPNPATALICFSIP